MPNILIHFFSDPFFFHKSTIPTPSQFVKYVIDSFEKSQGNLYSVNEHWRPQSACCPLCAFNYSVYGKYEDLYEDTAYIIIKSGQKEFFSKQYVKFIQIQNCNKNIRNLMFQNIDINHISRYSKSQRVKFWKSIEEKDKRKLRKLYKTDFDLFQYENELSHPS